MFPLFGYKVDKHDYVMQCWCQPAWAWGKSPPSVADPGGRGAMPPSVGGLKIFFRQYINIITKPTAYDGPWE